MYGVILIDIPMNRMVVHVTKETSIILYIFTLCNMYLTKITTRRNPTHTKHIHIITAKNIMIIMVIIPPFKNKVYSVSPS